MYWAPRSTVPLNSFGLRLVLIRPPKKKRLWSWIQAYGGKNSRLDRGSNSTTLPECKAVKLFSFQFFLEKALRGPPWEIFGPNRNLPSYSLAEDIMPRQVKTHHWFWKNMRLGQKLSHGGPLLSINGLGLQLHNSFTFYYLRAVNQSKDTKVWWHKITLHSLTWNIDPSSKGPMKWVINSDIRHCQSFSSNTRYYG